MTTPSAVSSGTLLAGTTVVFGNRTLLNSVTLVLRDRGAGDGAYIIVYDNASAASGKVMATAVASLNSPTAHLVFKNPIRADNGITVGVLGADAIAVLTYGG
jgi:hypothetical protein